jgi:hypothetical protein
MLSRQTVNYKVCDKLDGEKLKLEEEKRRKGDKNFLL